MVGFVFLAAIIYGFSLNRKKILIFLVSVYTALVLFFLFPFTVEIQAVELGINTELLLLGTFAIFVILMYYVYSGSLIKLALPMPKRGSGPFWQTVLLSIALAGVLLSIVFYIYDFEQIRLSEYVKLIFLNEVARFVWALAPLFIVMLMRKKE
jgi:hypothetical protein